MTTPWRYRCPREHSTITGLNGGQFRCKSCYRDPEIRTHKYRRKLDMAAGELVPA